VGTNYGITVAVIKIVVITLQAIFSMWELHMDTQTDTQMDGRTDGQGCPLMDAINGICH
jgi:hypothetical protein